jgi:hypothetical protein
MAIDRLLVERVDDGRFRPSIRAANVVRYVLEPGLRATGEEDARSFASEGPRDRGANRPTAPIDHSVLFLEQHFSLLTLRGGS